MTSYTNVFGGDTILPAFAQYQALSLSANTTLSWPIENRSGVNVLAKTLDVTSSGAFTITLPDARLGSVGYSTVIYNIGANAVSVNNAVGGALISIPSGGIFLIYLRTNGTQAGTWGSVQLSTGPSAATAASLASLSVINIGGTLNQAMPATILTTGYTLQTSDRASALVWNAGNGTITLPTGASMGSDFFFFVKGGGTGTVTLQPSGGELIDGASSLQIGNTGSTAVFFKSGGWYTLCLVQAPTLSYTRVVVDVSGTGGFTLTPSQFTNDLIEFTGTLTGNREIIFPTTVNQYVLKNSTTGAFSLGARTASQSPAIDMAGGTQYLFVCDGTNMGLVGTQPVLPALAGNALKYLRANASASALEFAAVGTLPRDARTSNTILGATDTGKLIDITSGTFTQTFAAASALGNGWFVYYRNSGTGTVTLDPNASETIGGATTCQVDPGEACIILSDGTNLQIVWLAVTRVTSFTVSGTYTPRPGIFRVLARAVGGGGGGGRSGSASTQGPGGGSGGYADGVLNVTPNVGITVTVGAAGTAAGSSGSAGGNGGDTSFNGLTANGGTSSTSISGGGAASGGSINFTGAPGWSDGNGGGNQCFGGSNPLGRGGYRYDTTTSGASGYGAGGWGGGASLNAGAGTAGYVEIEEIA